jgi:hypothetical protein
MIGPGGDYTHQLHIDTTGQFSYTFNDPRFGLNYGSSPGTHLVLSTISPGSSTPQIYATGVGSFDAFDFTYYTANGTPTVALNYLLAPGTTYQLSSNPAADETTTLSSRQNTDTVIGNFTNGHFAVRVTHSHISSILHFWGELLAVFPAVVFSLRRLTE